METLYDYVIVGSGPGGSVAGYRLAAAGASVLMLEAGKAYPADEYPDNELDANAQLMWHGGMEPTDNASLVLLRGRVLGGGSVVNQCLLDRFDALVWRDWSDRSGIAGFQEDTMDAAYEAVEQHLTLHRFAPGEWNGNAAKYVEAFDKCGYQWAPLRRGQADCQGQDCIVCLGGCRRDSKQSMPVTFLKKAMDEGMQVETECQAEAVIHGARFATVWARQRGRAVQFRGRTVLLAAGALGSAGLLLRSGFEANVPALGSNFYCHPQFMALARFDHVVDAHKGALQAVKSDDARFRARGFKLENVFAGPVATAMLHPGVGAAHQRFMADYRKLACMEVAVRDETPGALRLDRAGRLRIHKPMGEPERQRARAGLETIETLFRSLQPQEIVTTDLGIGLHLMGGCGQGEDDRHSVVGPDFRVHGYPRLAVVDGGLFPAAPGINPSLTIMARSWQAADRLLADAGSKGHLKSVGGKGRAVA
ncbi:GMC family oxidoreductase [Marinobacteraceae bacterium S3BR75-40.1]